MLLPFPTALGARIDMAIPGIVGFADPQRDVTAIAPAFIFTVPADDTLLIVPPDDMAAVVPPDDCLVVVPPDDCLLTVPPIDLVAEMTAPRSITVRARGGVFTLKAKPAKKVPAPHLTIRVI